MYCIFCVCASVCPKMHSHTHALYVYMRCVFACMCVSCNAHMHIRRFLQEKDVFERYCKQHLAKRLLSDPSQPIYTPTYTHTPYIHANTQVPTREGRFRAILQAAPRQEVAIRSQSVHGLGAESSADAQDGMWLPVHCEARGHVQRYWHVQDCAGPV